MSKLHTSPFCLAEQGTGFPTFQTEAHRVPLSLQNNMLVSKVLDHPETLCSCRGGKCIFQDLGSVLETHWVTLWMVMMRQEKRIKTRIPNPKWRLLFLQVSYRSSSGGCAWIRITPGEGYKADTEVRPHEAGGWGHQESLVCDFGEATLFLYSHVLRLLCAPSLVSPKPRSHLAAEQTH